MQAQRDIPIALRNDRSAIQLNLAVVTLTNSTFVANVTPFVSKEHLADLRTTFRDSHVVTRIGAEVVGIPFKVDLTFPGTERTFSSITDPSLITTLLRAAIIRFVHSRRLRLLKDRPPTFMNRQTNLITKAVSEVGSHPILDSLALYPTYSIDPRTIYRRHGEALFGLQLNCRLSVEIKATVDELIAFGLNVVDRYVVGQSNKRPLRDFELERDERAMRRILGRVLRVEGKRLILDDALEDDPVDANSVLLEPRFENLLDCLKLVPLRGMSRVQGNLSRERFRYSGGEGKLNLIQQLAARLSSAGTLNLALELDATVGDLLKPAWGSEGGELRNASPPRFVFDVAQTKVDDLPRSGLNKFGPFDVETFSARRAEVLVIVPETYRGVTELFLRKLKDGMAGTIWSKGFARKYHLTECRFQVEAFNSSFDQVTGYRDACIKALETGRKPNLAIVIVESSHRLLSGDNNPYLVSKSVLMSQGVPVQEINIETIRQSDSALPWTFDNLALASYAKMGGTPFVISTTQALAHELIIGVGSATIKRRRLGQSERVVGITTVFSTDGSYLFGNPSREVDYDNYSNELQGSLRELIELVRRRNGWQKGDDVRLIFHVFKPIRDIEARAVKAVVDKLTSQYRVQYAFVHVNSAHDWFLFDTANAGLGARAKAKFVPSRGLVLPLGERDTLLTVTGPSELKTAEQGVPRPLLLQLHRESTFKDLDYLSDQIFKFTSISWRQFLASSQPATIAYSEQIARLLGRLRHVKNWNPDILRTQLRSSRWFL